MKTKLANINASVRKMTGKAEMKIRKNSPEILLAAGLIGMVGTVVLACKATLRADEVLDHHRKKMADIHDAKEIADQNESGGELEYDDQLYRMDVGMQYAKTSGSLMKLYAPAIAVGSLSVAAILVSRNIMQKRYLGAVAFGNAVNSAFEEYRKRVREEEGELKDRHYRYGTDLGTIEEKETDENGKAKKVKKDFENADPAKMPADDTCRFFDSKNPNWDKNPNFSMMFLRGVQNTCNDLLHVRGHLFLNEVYDALGFDHTPQGAVLGWVEGIGDDYVDFGLYDQNKDNVRRFVNGEDNVILLEFNHAGVIWDKI